MDLLRGSYGETGIMDFDLISLRSLSSNNRTYRSMACTIPRKHVFSENFLFIARLQLYGNGFNVLNVILFKSCYLLFQANWFIY